MSVAAHSQRPSGHPENWRRVLTTADPGVPWVTYYQPGSGARVELSRATFDNWVAKAAGMLADECDVEQGSRVLLDLEPHWLLPVWAWATWALGATVALPGAESRTDAPTDVYITDNPSGGHSATTVLLSSKHPLGLPASQTSPGHTSPPGTIPAGVIDAMADIRVYPDVRSDPVPTPNFPLVIDAQHSLGPDASLVTLMQETPVQRAALLRSHPRDAKALARALLAPAFYGGALIIIDGGAPEDIEAIRVQEHADADLG